MNRSGIWKLVLVLALFGGAVFLLRPANRGNDGEENAKVWFYDQSAHKLYAAPRDTVPPDESHRGPANPGVRAMVVAFRGEENNVKKWEIAYLETCSPDLKNLLDRIRAAHQANVPFEGKIPARDSSFVRENTMVKRVDDAGWSATSSPEGEKILSEWQSWRGLDGQPPVVCMP